MKSMVLASTQSNPTLTPPIFPGAAELRHRASLARASLSACNWCEHRCGANRLAGEHGPCGVSAETYSFKRHVSFAEELELLPSFMVYFAGCNFRCAFCVQAPVCFDPARGAPVDAAALTTELLGQVARGARTINLLGGEPSIHLHTILEIAAHAAERGTRLPLVLNSNMYLTPHALALLDGVVDIYLADFKFGNDACASRIAKVANYTAVLQRNLLDIHNRALGTLMVRHLLMPGHFDCCFAPVVHWLASQLPAVRFNLMTSYLPAWQTARRNQAVDSLAGVCDPGEIGRAVALVRTLGLRQEAP